MKVVCIALVFVLPGRVISDHWVRPGVDVWYTLLKDSYIFKSL